MDPNGALRRQSAPCRNWETHGDPIKPMSMPGTASGTTAIPLVIRNIRDIYVHFRPGGQDYERYTGTELLRRPATILDSQTNAQY